jgi:hypothetical protein
MEVEYDKLAKDLFISHNKIREDPKSFILKLKKWSKKFRDKTLFLLDENPLETIEGINAVEEAIRFLSVQKSVPKLNYSEELSKAAKDHANDIGEHNLHGHDGSNGSILSDRIEKYTEWDDSCAESIDLGYKNADNIILNLLIDDGSEGRNQRINLFSTNYKHIGIGCAFHKSYNHCSVFVYAKSLRELGQAPNVGINFMQDYIQKTFYKRYVVNKFQEEDPDAPDDTIDIKINKCYKTIGGKEKKITKKIYTLKDQSLHIMEIEEN